MNRLYVIESSPTLTGAKAEHRLPIRSSDIEGFARGLAAAVGAAAGRPVRPGGPNEAKWIAAIGKDLQANRGRSVVMAGEFQPAAVHALAHAMNQALGNVGTTVTYGGSIEPQPVSQHASLAELSTAMDAGQVQLLVILGNNPVFTAPADVKFAERLAKVGLVVYHSLYLDETSELAHWNIPDTHALESWGDPRAYDGTVTLMQPLIAPLYDAHSAHELLASAHQSAGAEDARPRQGLLDARVRRRDGMDRPERRRRDVRERRLVLEAGRARRFHPRHGHVNRWSGHAVQAACGRPAAAPAAAAGAAGAVPAAAPAPTPAPTPAPAPTPLAPPPAAAGLELIFRPDPTVWDGRFANNGWLQEAPKPLTKLTWDTAALDQPEARRGKEPRPRRHHRAALPRSHGADARVHRAGPARPVGHRVPRLRPAHGRTRGHRERGSAGVQRLQAAHVGCALVRHRARDRQDRRPVPAGHDAGPPRDGGSSSGARRHARGVHARARDRRTHGSRVPQDAHPLSGPRVQGQQVGHGDRSDVVHRLRRLRRRLRGREQHPGRRQGAGQQRTARCTGSASTTTSRATSRRRSRCRRCTSRCRVSSARTRRARWSARSRPRPTAPKA